MLKYLYRFDCRWMNYITMGAVMFSLSCGPGKDRVNLRDPNLQAAAPKAQSGIRAGDDGLVLKSPTGSEKERARSTNTEAFHGYGITQAEMGLRALGFSREESWDQTTEGSMDFLTSKSLRSSGRAPKLTLQQRVTRINQAFNEAMLGCPERVWPKFRWDTHEVYLTDAAGQKAWMWKKKPKSSKGAATIVPYANVSLDLKSGWFSFPTNQTSVPQMGLSLTETADVNDLYYGSQTKGDYAVDLGIHESFHHDFQRRKDWTNVPYNQNVSRNTDYPRQYEPRYLRHMLSEKLLAFLQSRDIKHLKQAKFFLNEYDTKYLKEAQAIKSTDQTEGTAAYVETIGSAVAQVGCKTSEAKLVKKAFEMAKAQHSIFSEASTESYDIGRLAGLILRSLPKQKRWESKVQEGNTPLDILLKDVEPLSSPEDELIKEKVKTIINEANERMAKKLEPFLKILKSENTVRIFVPSSLGIGAYGVNAFIRHSETGYDLNVNQVGVFKSTGRNELNIEVSNFTTVDGDSFTDMPCTHNGQKVFGIVAFVDANSISKPVSQSLNLDFNSQIDAYTVMSLKIQDAPVEIKNDTKNVTWYCLK